MRCRRPSRCRRRPRPPMIDGKLRDSPKAMGPNSATSATPEAPQITHDTDGHARSEGRTEEGQGCCIGNHDNDDPPGCGNHGTQGQSPRCLGDDGPGKQRPFSCISFHQILLGQSLISASRHSVDRRESGGLPFAHGVRSAQPRADIAKDRGSAHRWCSDLTLSGPLGVRRPRRRGP